jgi:hypothetical protein
VFSGHAMQERVGGQSRRSDLNHDHHPLACPSK